MNMNISCFIKYNFFLTVEYIDNFFFGWFLNVGRVLYEDDTYNVLNFICFFLSITIACFLNMYFQL